MVNYLPSEEPRAILCFPFQNEHHQLQLYKQGTMARSDQPAPLSFSNLLNQEVNMNLQSPRFQIVQINDEIHGLNEIKKKRCISVSQLPHEVLSTIFECMTSDHDLESYFDLLSATQVCRLWRQVALDSPRMWSAIDCSATPHLVELSLERSKSAPLHLLGSFPRDNMSVNVPKILNHLDQLKGIELYGCEPDWSGRIISQGAPQLESLSLRSLSFNNYGEIETFHLPVNAFPVLQHLELFGFIYTSSVASLTTLRSLTINPGGNIPKSHLPSSVEFLAILASLPNLSELSLTKALAPSVGPLPSSSVMLTHLTRLYIMDDILNIGIMACITAPQLKAIDLHHQYGDTSAEIATAVAVVAAIFRKLPTFTTSCSELSLSVTDSSFAGVKLWDDCTTCEIAKREPFFKMLIHGAGDLRVEESFLTLFPPTTCPPTLYLEFRVDTASHCAQYARLQHILRQLTHVTEVRTSNCKTLINVLDDTHPTISLPSLKEIGPTINSGSCKRLWPKLVEQLKVRKELHDVEIEKLVILDIYNLLTSADLKPFEGLVKVSKRKSELNYQPIFF